MIAYIFLQLIFQIYLMRQVFALDGVYKKTLSADNF